MADATGGVVSTDDVGTNDETPNVPVVAEPTAGAEPSADVSGVGAPPVADESNLQPAESVVSAAQQSDGFNPVAGARQLFADFLGSGEQTALLLDGQGLAWSPAHISSPTDGMSRNRLAPHTSGVSDEANRAMRHLELGGWVVHRFRDPRDHRRDGAAPQCLGLTARRHCVGRGRPLRASRFRAAPVASCYRSRATVALARL